MKTPILYRISTVPVSLKCLLGSQLQYMNRHFRVVAVASGGKELDELGQQLRIPVRKVNMTRRITPFKDLAALWKLYRLFITERPDIVHTHTPKAGLLGMMAARMAGVPVRLHTVAGLPLMETTGVKRKILQWAEKVTYSCANKVYPNSSGLKEFMLSRKLCPAEKLKVLGNGSSNGIDTCYFSAESVTEASRQRLQNVHGIDSTHTVFCFIGRIVKDKGIIELVAAFEKLYATDNKVRLLLVGDFEKDLYPLPPTVEQAIFTHPGILFVGWQTDVRPYLAVSHILVFPSYREGFPNVVMQAGAMGLPAIVSDINGCNEIIIPHENGIIVPAKNSEHLLAAMSLLRSNTTLREKMKTAARDLIVKRYNQQELLSIILLEYKTLMEKYVS